MSERYPLIAIFLLFSMFYCVGQVSPSTTNETTNRTQVEMVTNYGVMVIELYNETPAHRDNFIQLATNKSYDSLLFHRVIENFMIQGGDPASKGAGSERVLGEGDLEYTVPAEFHPNLFHRKGALAAARSDHPERASSAIQFYIVQGKVFNDTLLNQTNKRINKMLARHYLRKDAAHQALMTDFEAAIQKKDTARYYMLNDSITSLADSYTKFDPYTIPENHRQVYKNVGGTPHLDQNYTVFGQVISGLDVIDAIAAVPTSRSDRPLRDVRIISVRIKK